MKDQTTAVGEPWVTLSEGGSVGAEPVLLTAPHEEPQSPAQDLSSIRQPTWMNAKVLLQILSHEVNAPAQDIHNFTPKTEDKELGHLGGLRSHEEKALSLIKVRLNKISLIRASIL